MCIRILYPLLTVFIMTTSVFGYCNTDTTITSLPVSLPQINDSSHHHINVDSIIISGNKKTKNYIIRRELTFKEGDSLDAAKIYSILEQSRELIYNTNLFSIVSIKPQLTSAYNMNIIVSVLERWYIYPAPQFKLIDRNVNEWWKTYNADLNRVTYGIKYTQYNFSGRADQLNLYMLNGYSRNFTAVYTAPYTNNQLTEGISFAAGYSEAREFPYKTNYQNKLLNFRSDKYDRKTYSISGTYRIRRGLYKKHFITLQYTSMTVIDSVLQPAYNPSYFNSNKSNIGFFDISYVYQYVNTDNINFPQKGKIITFGINKRGLGISGGINMLSADFSFRKYYPHAAGFFSSVAFMGKIKLPFKQAYINQRALGYGDFYMSGLENYVVDGVAAAVAKYNLYKKLISFKIPVPFHIKALPYIPFGFYGKLYGETGFAYNKLELDTRLNNRLLYSGGFGIDILSLYDLRLSVEYSFNQLGEKGLFLHSRSIL